PPYDVHPFCHPSDMSVSDFKIGRFHPHLGYPPCRVFTYRKWSPCSHLDDDASGATFENPDPAIMREPFGPALDLARGLEHEIGAPSHAPFIHPLHPLRQVATSRNPGRCSTFASMPARESRVASSIRV